MRTLPTTMVQVLAPFVPLFSERVWAHVQLLVAGAILASGKRTVASALGAVVYNKKALLPLPSGFEPCRLVKPASKPRTARVAR